MDEILVTSEQEGFIELLKAQCIPEDEMPEGWRQALDFCQMSLDDSGIDFEIVALFDCKEKCFHLRIWPKEK